MYYPLCIAFRGALCSRNLYLSEEGDCLLRPMCTRMATDVIARA